MKTKYVEPKGYFSSDMEKAFNAAVKKQGEKKTTSTAKKPVAKKPATKKKSK